MIRDVLGWSAAETASLLELSVPAANSALQRARETLRTRLPERREEWTAPGATAGERELLARFVEAHERSDGDAIAGLLAAEVTFHMPPQPERSRGAEVEELCRGALRMGQWRMLPIAVNGMPATACYLKAPGEDAFRALTMDVLRVEDGLIAEITTFSAGFITRFGLPASL